MNFNVAIPHRVPFLLGDHAQARFVGMDIGLMQRIGNGLEGFDGAVNFDRFAAVHNIIRPRSMPSSKALSKDNWLDGKAK
jgi:hypothetical protein